MRTDVKRRGWTISAEGDDFADRFLESVFFTGNGRMGARGYPAYRPVRRPLDAGIFLAGFYDRISDSTELTDFVNLPTPIWYQIRLNGRTPTVPSHLSRELDLRTGLLTFRYRLSIADDWVDVQEQRFFSLARPSLLFQRLEFRGCGPVELLAGIDHQSCNSPIPDDQVKENTQIIQMTRFCSSEEADAGFTARYETKHTKLALVQTISCRTEGFFTPAFVLDTGDGVGVRCTGDASHAPIALEIAARLTSSRDVDPLLRLDVEPSWDFADALAENQTAWEQKWADCDITMEGDDDAQTALHYVIYQLVANCSPRDHTVSIGARGLTHTRYKGCYFWDTDLFLTPFYNLTDPQAARSLANFRVGTLPQAKEHAVRMNSAGARYPWMVSYDGSEQCESWDIGCSEVHVTADVAYALGQYLDWTGDDSLFFQGGAQVLVETARFWVSRYSPAPEPGKVNLLFCKGPDEYCGITSNNLFTNTMVKHNLSLALAATARLKQEAPEQYAALGLSEEECAVWERLRGAIQLPRDPVTGRYRQDDTFHLLEHIDPAELKSGDEASYHRVCFDRLQRYQVIKQADTLLLMTRLPEQFTEEEKLAAWEDFEPLCIHDSTLSFASHALFAAQNGQEEAADAYWRKALYLDLEEVMGNTGKEGLHLACLGEVWQTVVFGFAGLHIADGIPQLAPHLPHGCTSLSFKFFYHGKKYEAKISGSSWSIQV